MKLYELAEQYNEVFDLLDNPEWDEDTVAEMLASIEDDIDVKVEGYARIIRNLEAEQELCKREADRFAKRAKSKANEVDWLKRNLQNMLYMTGRREVKTDLFNIRIQKNPHSLIMDTEDLREIPRCYLIEQDPKVDKKRIMADLKDGLELTFAHLEQGESVRIR